MSFTRQNVLQMISIHFHKRWESIIRLLGLPWLDYSVTANTASADASLARTLKNQNQSPLQLLDIQSTSPSSSRSSDCSNTIQIRPAVVSYRHCRNLQIKWNISFSCFTCLTRGGCHNGMCPWRKKKSLRIWKIFYIHSEIVPSTVWTFHAASKPIHAIINIRGFLCAFGFCLMKREDICYSISSRLIRNTTHCHDYLPISVIDCYIASELIWDIPALSGGWWPAERISFPFSHCMLGVDVNTTAYWQENK